MKKYFKYIIIGLVALFLIPLVFNFLNMFIPMPTIITSDGWAGFYGGYLGSGIGAFATLVAVYLTIKDETKKLQLQREEIADRFNLERKLAIKPYFDIQEITRTNIDESFMGMKCISFELRDYEIYEEQWERIEHLGDSEYRTPQRYKYRTVDYVWGKTNQLSIRPLGNMGDAILFPSEIDMYSGAGVVIDYYSCSMGLQEEETVNRVYFSIRNIGTGPAIASFGFSEDENEIILASNEKILLAIRMSMVKSSANMNITIKYKDIESRGNYSLGMGIAFEKYTKRDKTLLKHVTEITGPFDIG